MYKNLSKTADFSKVFSADVLLSILQVMLGATFFGILAQAKLQVGLVPVTLQTLGVFLLAFSLGGKKAMFALVMYLVEISFGWPVLAGGAMNPLWLLGPTAGYLIAFPIAAYIIGRAVEKMKKVSFFSIIASSLVGVCVIYLCGATWLSYFIGFKKAVAVGVVPFIGVDCVKLLLAVLLFSPIHWVKNKVKSLN